MKKSAWLIILLLLLQVNVYASTNTRPRSEDDLLVPGYITVTDTNLLMLVKKYMILPIFYQMKKRVVYIILLKTILMELIMI